MELDDKVCLCFRITKRKLVNFARRELPRVASQLSQCGGAGTGCGWCIPFLKKIFEQESSKKSGADSAAILDGITAEDYARQRADYVRAGKGKPPAGAEPLPDPPSETLPTG